MLRAHCGRHVYQVGGIFLLPYSSTSDLLEQVWRVGIYRGPLKHVAANYSMASK